MHAIGSRRAAKLLPWYILGSYGAKTGGPMFKSKSPIPYIVIAVIVVALGIVMLVTGETEFHGHWEW